MQPPSVPECYEYFLIRVAPDPVRNEAVNIGVALIHPNGGYAGVRFVSDYRRIHCLFPQFNLSDLDGLDREVEALLANTCEDPSAPLNRNYFLSLARETFANGLQFTGPKPVLTADPEQELQTLYERFAEPYRDASGRQQANGRKALVQHLQNVFTEHGLSPYLRRNARVSEWGLHHDPFRFDFATTMGRLTAVQAVMLGGTTAPVKELSFTTARLRQAGMAVNVRAVVEEAAPESALAAFHQELLTEAEIEVFALSRSAQLAEQLRASLRAQ